MERCRIGRFLTLSKSMQRPGDWHGNIDHPNIEISYLIDGEHQTARALFGALVPFAGVRDGLDYDLTHTYVDLVCLDFRDRSIEPPVVLWRAHAALEALFVWDALPIEDASDETGEHAMNLDWSSFVDPVAPQTPPPHTPTQRFRSPAQLAALVLWLLAEADKARARSRRLTGWQRPRGRVPQQRLRRRRRLRWSSPCTQSGLSCRRRAQAPCVGYPPGM